MGKGLTRVPNIAVISELKGTEVLVTFIACEGPGHQLPAEARSLEYGRLRNRGTDCQPTPTTTCWVTVGESADLSGPVS